MVYVIQDVKKNVSHNRYLYLNIRTVILKAAAKMLRFLTYSNRRLYFPKQDIDDKPHK